jgi:hypothetical protein
MCSHEHTHIQVLNTSVEVWQNGVGEWVEQEGGIKVCDDCGAIYNNETNHWEQ